MLHAASNTCDRSVWVLKIERVKLLKYIKIMRLDHWIKQVFIIPGSIAALLLTGASLKIGLLEKFILGFFATCLIASANYVINEWLDAEFDRYHPTKKNRSVVTEDVKGGVVYALYAFLTIAGLAISYWVNIPFLAMSAFLWVMGVAYNVKPLRTKDIPFFDVLTESINNAIRLFMGWFIITKDVFPPCSLALGYWMAGAYLMAIKRFAEYKMINDPETAGLYRRSFKHYTEHSLLNSAFFYAMCSVFFIGVFLVKYRIELILFVPFLIGLFCTYFRLSFIADSPVQKPEKLFHEKGLMLYCLLLVAIFTVLMLFDIPWLSSLADNKLIHMP